jgi:WD40 repeat protein
MVDQDCDFASAMNQSIAVIANRADPIGHAAHHIASILPNCGAASPDGSLILTACYDRTARLWDAASGAVRRTILPLREGWVHLSPEGWVTAYAPEAWRYLHGVETLPDGKRRVVNLWDHAEAA